ncbi:phospholipid transport system substrate-binding protein [Desulfobotulus alkaliphilus]|uniref:Phospholipid transport system substrate-binding protein n=1 Tax=Desulfobotulus alkaliphilus TaxID=622671 RepID=A0A562REV0_9BACT|nr:ABC transporter substrate-binding protein [Desulfobotulus alkaliphilus]TWI66936.1 phospholipid transport system substrate-binding protein [Desulfobotulus alkaliphilus]
MQNLLKIFGVLICLIIFPLAASADMGPLETIKVRINDAIALLKDPAYKDADPALAEKQHQELFEHVKGIFDFRTVSMLATGRNWRRFSTEQQNEFADLFAKLLANTYIEKVQDNFRNEEVVFDDETIISEGRAEVSTRVLLSNMEVPVIYRLRNIRNQWRIYDVQIEGISLVQNYRSQFEDFLFRREPAELIDVMKQRIDRLEKDRIQRRKEGRPADTDAEDMLRIL